MKFINGEHGSNAIKQCIDLLERFMSDSGFVDINKVILALKVIEPLVLNRENVDLAIEQELLTKLSKLISSSQLLNTYKKEKIYLNPDERER